MRKPWVDHRRLPGVAKPDIMLKLLALLCVFFVVVALLLMYQSPTAGYELSIYSATPAGVWVLLFLSLLGGIFIVVHQLASGRYQETRTYLIGFAVIMLTATAFLCLPVIRNYFTWRGDQMAHIGFVKDIATSGHLPGYNPYPVTHTVLFEISAVLDWPIDQVVNLNTPLIFMVFVLVTFLLTTVVLPHRGQQLTATLFAAGTMAALSRFNLVPNTWSMLLLPLFFYCYFRREEPAFRILLIMLIIAYPFIHPLSALIIIVSLAAIEFLKPVYARLLRRSGAEVPAWIGNGPVLWPLAMELLVFLPWVFTRSAFRSNVDALWWQLINFSGSSQGSRAVESLAKVDLDAGGIVSIIVKMYGQIFLVGVLASLGILIVYWQLRSLNREDAGGQDWSRADGREPYQGADDPGFEAQYSGDDNRLRLVFVGVLFIIFTLAYFAFYAGAPGAESLSATRIVVYVELAAIPLVGFTLWQLAGRARLRGLAWSLVTIIIIVACVLNVAGHHNSPWQIRPGDQVSDSDIQGMEWLLHEKDPTAYTFFIMSSPDRFSQAILGATVTSTRTDVKDISWLQFRDHFGYVALPNVEGSRAHTTVGELYPVDVYANINRYDKVAYQTVWKSLDRFNDADFEKFEQDPTVNRIYSDGASDAYYITGHLQDTG